MVIDFCAHHSSRYRMEFLADRYRSLGLGQQFKHPEEILNTEFRLEHMRKYGVDMQVLVPASEAQLVSLGCTDQEIQDICTHSNTAAYEVCKAYPDKFVFFGLFSLANVGGGLKEVDRCIEELGCRGFTTATNHKGIGLDSPEYFPFYEKLVKNDLPLFLHPVHWESYGLVDMKKGWRMMHVFGWPFDTTQAVWRLIFGGVLDRFPELKIVTHHLGGMLPYYSRRIEVNYQMFLKDDLPKPIGEYWGGIYGDTALDGTVASFPCGYAFFGPDRMLFGTDYPMGPEDGEFFIRENLNGVGAMDIPREAREKILGGNAARLLKMG